MGTGGKVLLRAVVPIILLEIVFVGRVLIGLQGDFLVNGRTHHVSVRLCVAMGDLELAGFHHAGSLAGIPRDK